MEQDQWIGKNGEVPCVPSGPLYLHTFPARCKVETGDEMPASPIDLRDVVP
jgi:hypothetical protein